MFAFQAGGKPALTICALAALLGLAGCSSAQTSSYTSDNVAVASSAEQAVAQAAVVDVEDDGLPAQTPPSSRIRQLPDDPSEPYSRNYGGLNPSVRADDKDQSEPSGRTPESHPAVPHDLPPDFRKQLVSALAQDE